MWLPCVFLYQLEGVIFSLLQIKMNYSPTRTLFIQIFWYWRMQHVAWKIATIIIVDVGLQQPFGLSVSYQLAFRLISDN